MADRGRLTLAARVRWRLTPWWGRVLLVYGASRVVTLLILLAFAAVQGAADGTPAPDYAHFATTWDALWYQQIATVGYPTVLPLDDAGHVAQNAWAFLPGFPYLTGILARAGLGFAAAGVLVSLVFGALAALLFYRLMRDTLPAGSSLFAVVLLCTAPLSPMFQVSYAESMGLALLFLALLLVRRRRFWLVLPVIVAMALTRPTGLAFAFFLLLYFVTRIVQRVRHPDAHPLPRHEIVGIVVAGLLSFAAGLAWPAIAWAVTGSPSAYTDTELAWRVGYVGHGELVPFTAWFQGAHFWLGFWGVPEVLSWPVGIVAVLVVVAGFGIFLALPWTRRLAIELRLWLVAYLGYLLAVFFPQSSIWRLLLPMAPALGALAVPRSRVLRVALVAAGIAGQVLWVHWCWWHDGWDWSPP